MHKLLLLVAALPCIAAAQTATVASQVVSSASPAYGEPRRTSPDPKDMSAYKVAVAQRIADMSAYSVKTDAPRPADAVIRGLTVVTMYVNKTGHIDKLLVLRSSGNDELDKRAVEAIKLAEPLPLPPDNVTLGNEYTVFPESFIHRTDGRFQLVTKTRSGSEGGPALAKSASGIKRASTAAQ